MDARIMNNLKDKIEKNFTGSMNPSSLSQEEIKNLKIMSRDLLSSENSVNDMYKNLETLEKIPLTEQEFGLPLKIGLSAPAGFMLGAAYAGYLGKEAIFSEILPLATAGLFTGVMVAYLTDKIYKDYKEKQHARRIKQQQQDCQTKRFIIDSIIAHTEVCHKEKEQPQAEIQSYQKELKKKTEIIQSIEKNLPKEEKVQKKDSDKNF